MLGTGRESGVRFPAKKFRKSKESMTDDDFSMAAYMATECVAEGLISGFGSCQSEGRELNELQQVHMTTAIFVAMSELQTRLKCHFEASSTYKRLMQPVDDHNIESLILRHGGIVND